MKERLLKPHITSTIAAGIAVVAMGAGIIQERRAVSHLASLENKINRLQEENEVLIWRICVAENASKSSSGKRYPATCFKRWQDVRNSGIER